MVIWTGCKTETGVVRNICTPFGVEDRERLQEEMELIETEENLYDFHEKVFLVVLGRNADEAMYHPKDAVEIAQKFALEAVRQWSTIRAERDAAIADVMKGDGK